MPNGTPFPRPSIQDQPDFSHPLMRGLVGWWPLLEKGGLTARDVSVVRNHGTLTNMEQGDWSARGLDCDGSNEYINTSNNTGISGDAAFSISAWIKPDLLTSLQTVAGAHNASALAAMSLWINVAPGGAGTGSAGNGNVSLEFQGGNGGRTANGTLPSTGQWYHIVGVKTPGAISSTSTIYVNGANVPLSTSSSNTPNITPSNVRLGTWDGVNYQFDGHIDDVRIYNRALSAAEVRMLYLDPWAPFRRRMFRIKVPPTILTPTATSMVMSSVDPTVVVSATPTASSMVMSSVDPTTVKGSLSVTPTATSMVMTSVNPLADVTVTPTASSMIMTTVDPTVLNNLLVTPSAVTMVMAGVDPDVLKSALAGDIYTWDHAANRITVSDEMV